MRIMTNENKDVDLAAAVLKAKSFKEAMRVATEAYAEAEAEVIELIRDREQKSATVTLNDRVIKATVAQREVVNIDESGLRKALGAALFDRFCTKKLDKGSLKHGISEGLVDPIIVAQHSQISMGKAYVLFSEPTEKEPDD